MMTMFDDVHGTDTVEVVGEVGAYAEGRLAVVRGVTLDLEGVVYVKGVAEYHLLGTGIDAKGAVLVHDAHELFAVVPAVHSQPLEQVGEVLRKVQAEDVPAETVVEEGAEGSPESVAPAVHGYVVGHLRAVHAADGADELVGHGADRYEVVFHGQVDIARAYEAPGPLTASRAVLHCPDYRVLSLE